jgi:hypothetical protein
MTNREEGWIKRKERGDAVIFRPPKRKVNREDVRLVSRGNLLPFCLSVNKRLP